MSTKEIILKPQQREELLKNIRGSGGFQSLITKLQENFNKDTNKIKLDDNLLEKIERYTNGYNNGGWQKRLNAIFKGHDLSEVSQTYSTIKVGVIGVTGYAGIELLRFLYGHPKTKIIAISSRSEAGQRVDKMFVSLVGQSDLVFSKPDDAILDTCDVIFFATPHGVAMKNAGAFIEKDIKVIDLGADFRLNDEREYQKWYGSEHTESKLLTDAVYGLCEINREQIKNAKLIANPGCYPTAIQLALKPLIDKELIDLSSIIADCKSGVSGAGRGANQATLLCEVSESFKAYGVSGHRHYPEIKQELALLAGESVELTFVPHLVPMIRGMQATLYVDLLDNDIDIQSVFEDVYKDEHFVTILGAGVVPETRNVRASNFCQIAVQKVPDSNKLIVISVIDNLVKGASGQAIQNMNIMFGLDEDLGLEQIGLLP
ncbi:MAG: N-acetyl-gamma-glutamyl-phosphate reductase [Gammaproteobacteria bacterium]|nr:N-acetyl-gamma-glutamyl-phosphate reductase [Gammaproteobacteria bacterium]